jgi:hypothetical protein
MPEGPTRQKLIEATDKADNSAELLKLSRQHYEETQKGQRILQKVMQQVQDASGGHHPCRRDAVCFTSSQDTNPS